MIGEIYVFENPPYMNYKNTSMKKIVLAIRLVIALLLCASIFFSCKNSEKENVESSFTWNYKGTTYSAKFIKVSSLDDLGPNVIGGLGSSMLSSGSGPSFKLIPLTAGTFPLDGSFSFVDTEGFDLTGTGQLVVSSVQGGRMTASINAMVTGPSGTNQLTVTIKNVPITN